MNKKNQALIMKVSFRVKKTFNRKQGMQLELVGHIQPDYEQTAKTRFIHDMQDPESPFGSWN